MKILLTEPEFFPNDFLESLKKFGKVVPKRTTREELKEEIKDTDILIGRVETKIDNEILKNAKNLKLIISVTTALDHIDVEEAKKRGIEVFNPVGYATTAVAEYTMALILSLARRIPWAHYRLSLGGWDRHEFLGNELSRKTLGLIGFGKIGRKVAEYAKTFGMNIVYFDPYIDKKTAEEIGAREVSFDELLSISDIISIHAFLSKETENMINIQQLSKMKRNAMLINVARGDIVNEKDLVEALKQGIIAGAAVDVFSQEPLDRSSELVKFASQSNNLILTPHIAGSSADAIKNASEIVLQKISEFVEGRK